MLVEQLRERLGQSYRRKVALEELQESPGWKDYERELDAQIRANRMSAFSVQATTLDDMVAREHSITRAEGLLVARMLCQSMIDDLAADIEALEEEVRRAEEVPENQ
jgi:hypothetical protein